MDGMRAHATTDEGAVDKNPVAKAQDFHTLLAKVLEGYVEIQKSSFVFDLFYKGKLHKDVEFIPFVPFFTV